jgi:hypothetical protein
VDSVPRWGLCNSNYLGDGLLVPLGRPALLGRQGVRPDAAQRSPAGSSVWIGFVGALAGISFIGCHIDRSHSVLGDGELVLTPATALLAVFVLGVVILMWRRSSESKVRLAQSRQPP